MYFENYIHVATNVIRTYKKLIYLSPFIGKHFAFYNHRLKNIMQTENVVVYI